MAFVTELQFMGDFSKERATITQISFDQFQSISKQLILGGCSGLLFEILTKIIFGYANV